MTKYTFQIIINVKSFSYDRGYELFENLQNSFNLFDNCVIETSLDGLITNKIIIESTDEKRLKSLANKIKKDYKLKDVKVKKINKKDTIIENGRDSEIGGYPV